MMILIKQNMKECLEKKAKIDQETADELGEIEDRLETTKRDFKTKFSNRPTSWFESKLIGFKKDAY